MIPRYTRPAMARTFSDEHRFATWLRVEIAHLETIEEAGIAPKGTAAAVRNRARVSPERIVDLEETLQHDVIAFLTNAGEGLGDERKWLHYGMTSSDLVDTAQALMLDEALGSIEADWESLGRLLRSLALRYKGLMMVGRTHGVHAEPITFGFKVLGWYTETARQAERLSHARKEIRHGKISGAVGTATHIPPPIEERILSRLGLQAEPSATQVIPRDRHAHLLATLAGMGGSLERFATEIRHLQRTEVRELEEPFGAGQKGSSAMPHKRNPVICERIAGLARLLRSYAAVGFENTALWHERDISHSSAERVVLPDACTLLDYMVDKMRFVLGGLVVREGAMRANLDATGGLIFSQKVLLALTEAIGDRERAYRIVQSHAMKVWEEGGSFRERLSNDPEVASHLSAESLAALFDPKIFVRNLDAIYERALATTWGKE